MTTVDKVFVVYTWHLQGKICHYLAIQLRKKIEKILKNKKVRPKTKCSGFFGPPCIKEIDTLLAKFRVFFAAFLDFFLIRNGRSYKPMLMISNCKHQHTTVYLVYDFEKSRSKIVTVWVPDWKNYKMSTMALFGFDHSCVDGVNMLCTHTVVFTRYKIVSILTEGFYMSFCMFVVKMLRGCSLKWASKVIF